MMIAGDIDAWGYIPEFLDERDPRPAREQFNEKYIGGWLPLHGGTFDRERLIYRFPGDPPFKSVSVLKFRNETIVLFAHSIVLIVQPDGTWEVSRMD